VVILVLRVYDQIGFKYASKKTSSTMYS
jgi:hypothetical protein